MFSNIILMLVIQNLYTFSFLFFSVWISASYNFEDNWNKKKYEKSTKKSSFSQNCFYSIILESNSQDKFYG